MTAPTGCKRCRDCGQEKPIATDFVLVKGKSGLLPESYCRECKRIRWHKWAATARTRKEPAQQTRHWPRPQHETACDHAFMQWQGGTPRQDWRVCL